MVNIIENRKEKNMKVSKNVSFKNCFFRVTEDEINGEKRIWIIEETKEEEIYTDFNDILNEFDGEEGLSISIKVEKGSLEE
jgi:hypothetical protein